MLLKVGEKGEDNFGKKKNRWAHKEKISVFQTFRGLTKKHRLTKKRMAAFRIFPIQFHTYLNRVKTRYRPGPHPQTTVRSRSLSIHSLTSREDLDFIPSLSIASSSAMASAVLESVVVPRARCSLIAASPPHAAARSPASSAVGGRGLGFASEFSVLKITRRAQRVASAVGPASRRGGVRRGSVVCEAKGTVIEGKFSFD